MNETDNIYFNKKNKNYSNNNNKKVKIFQIYLMINLIFL